MAIVDPKILLAEIKKVFGPEAQNITEETIKTCIDVSELLSQGKMRVRDALQIPQKNLEMLYAIAYNLYQDNKIEKANNIFTLLCTYDPMDIRFWEGLGATLKLLKRYNEAICAYGILIQIHALKISYYLDLTECFIKTKQLETAKQCCELVIFMAENETFKAENSDAASCLTKAKILQKVLNK